MSVALLSNFSKFAKFPNFPNFPNFPIDCASFLSHCGS